MKDDKLMRAVGGIDEDLIEAAENAGKAKKKSANARKIWIPAAAAIVLAAGIGTAAMMNGRRRETIGTEAAGTEAGETGTAGTEAVFESAYVYRVKEGDYAAYTPGKVIDAAKVGETLADVTVTGAWQYSDGRREGEEMLRAQVYDITGVPQEIAVCLRFLDKGDALTTDHYYVLVNMDADTSAVSEYIIRPAEADPSLE